MKVLGSESNNKKNWIVLAIAVVLAVLAAWLASYYLEYKETEMKSTLLGNNNDKVAILVPKIAVAPGDIIGPENMVVREVPAKYLPDGVFTPGQFKSLIGRTFTSHLSPGRPLTEMSVSGSGIEQFSDLLEEGQRAITIPMDEFNSTAGMLVAGDRIDLFLLAKKNIIDESEGQSKDSALYLVFEDALVLATGKNTVEGSVDEFEPEMDQYSTITLGVPLRDAGRIGLAREDGKFVALLRNRADNQRVSHQLIGTNDLYQHIAKNESKVEFIIGGKSKNGLAQAEEIKVEQQVRFKKFNQLKGIETAGK